MNVTTVGVLTISDRCARKETVDESGPSLVDLIGAGIIRNGRVVKTDLVPDRKEDIEEVLKRWCDDDNIHLILTTGGTGLSQRDVTPEATLGVLEKTVPGIPNLMFKHSSAVTHLAALSRAVAGIRGKSLIINLPGSKKASRECLEAVASVIPHAVDLINDRKKEVEGVHRELKKKKKSSVIADHVQDKSTGSLYPCISVDEAQRIVITRINLMGQKTVGYEQALGHVLAEQVVAQGDHPPFDASLRDGYAVRSEDGPLGIRTVIDVCRMGECPPDKSVVSGTCMRISTGGPIPPGATAVVQVEDTKLESPNSDGEECIQITLGSFSGLDTNIREKGSDYRKGEVLLDIGTYLDPAGVGCLAAAGVASVRVFCKPVVAVMSTGNELCHPYEDLKPGKVRDSNRVTLISLLKENNFETVDLGITPDDPDSLLESLEKGFQAADVVVTTGSMSMGERDFLKEIIVSDFGGEICFGRVFMKPGKPTAFGILTYEGRPKVWFGLPGNPASAVVTAQLFLLPGLRKMSGRKKVCPTKLFVKVEGALPSMEDRPHFVRGIAHYKKESNYWAVSIPEKQRSSWIGSCVNANCLVLNQPQYSKTCAEGYWASLIGESYE